MTTTRKGNAWVTIAALVLLFVVTLVWIVMSQVYVPNLFPLIGPELQAYPEAYETFGYIKTAWNNWPLVIVAGLVIWAIVSAQREEPRFQAY